MKIVFKYLLILVVIGLSSYSAIGQFGFGLTVSHDLYNRYANPSDGIAHNANGSALLNLGIGPKVWVGGEKASLSVEGQAVWGIFGASLPDYKGLGNIAFPVLAKLNFAGLSSLNKEGRFGLSIGGGIQWSKSELYYLKNSFEDSGVNRGFFRTYVIQAGYGFGLAGFGGQLFVRYGYNPDLDGANTINIGLQYDFNFSRLSRIDDPASAL